MTAAASRADATNLNDKAKHTASHGRDAADHGLVR